MTRSLHLVASAPWVEESARKRAKGGRTTNTRSSKLGCAPATGISDFDCGKMPSATAPPQLPVIDISPFLSPSADAPTRESTARAATAEAIHEACSRFGFFYVTGLDSVVSPDEMQEALAQARSFFARPEEEKALLKIRKGDGARGWQKLGQNVTQYKGESIGML